MTFRNPNRDVHFYRVFGFHANGKPSVLPDDPHVAPTGAPYIDLMRTDRFFYTEHEGGQEVQVILKWNDDDGKFPPTTPLECGGFNPGRKMSTVRITDPGDPKRRSTGSYIDIPVIDEMTTKESDQLIRWVFKDSDKYAGNRKVSRRHIVTHLSSHEGGPGTQHPNWPGGLLNGYGFRTIRGQPLTVLNDPRVWYDVERIDECYVDLIAGKTNTRDGETVEVGSVDGLNSTRQRKIIRLQNDFLDDDTTWPNVNQELTGITPLRLDPFQNVINIFWPFPPIVQREHWIGFTYTEKNGVPYPDAAGAVKYVFNVYVDAGSKDAAYYGSLPGYQQIENDFAHDITVSMNVIQQAPGSGDDIAPSFRP